MAMFCASCSVCRDMEAARAIGREVKMSNQRQGDLWASVMVIVGILYAALAT